MNKELKKTRKGWEPDVMTPEETLAFFDSKGIKYTMCDTVVPVLSNKVSCGVPKDVSDPVIDDYYHLPKSVVGLHPVMEIPAQGESMIEADIHDGDLLQTELGADAHDGDIVVADIDNECTAKVLFTDAQQQKWLLPRNKEYDAILLTRNKKTKISGVVRNIVKKAPRMSYSECIAIVNRTLEKKNRQTDVFERLRKAVADGYHLFWAASSWAVAYAVLRDCHGYEGSVSDFERKVGNLTLPMNFTYECSSGNVQRTMSNHPYMRWHIDKWRENGASSREIILMEFLRKNM